MTSLNKFLNEPEILTGIEYINEQIRNYVNRYISFCDKKDIKTTVKNLINIQTFVDEIPLVSKEIRVKI